MSIDFKSLADELLGRSKSLLESWFPAGKYRGSEYVLGDLSGSAGESLSINWRTGFWKDFASGDAGGDLISLYAAAHGISQLEAAKELGGEDDGARTPRAKVAAKPREPEPPKRPTLPAVGTHDCHHRVFGKPSALWPYLDAAGALLGYVARYDPEGERKQIVPWTYAADGWGMGQWSDPRPLYGLQLLDGNNKPVMLVEGEKAADAARKIAGHVYVVMTWPGGAQAWKKVDWSPLAGRAVLMWPDNDGPGYSAMGSIANHIKASCPEIKLIDSSKDDAVPDGWDAADALADGMDWAGFRAWAKPRVIVLTDEQPAPEEPPPPSNVERLERPEPSRPTLRVVEGNTVRELAPLPEGVPPEYSDDSLAIAFTKMYGHELRYVAAWGRWMRWNGTHWDYDSTLHVFDLARACCRKFAMQAETDTDLTPAQQGRVATHLASSKTIAAVEKLAKADRRHAATIEQWDANPWLLNTPGGTVDLQTGKMRNHNQEDYITKCVSVAPGGECPTWMGFVDRVTGGDTELQAFLQRFIGYALTGVIREHALGFFYGTGGNGKGTFLNTITSILGEYGCVAGMEVFTESRGDRHSTEIARLRGARLVTAQETEEGRRWAESRIKALTGGDPITARFMRQDDFTFLPQFKLLIAGNHKPGLRNVDEAMRRRFNLIPFTQTITAEERDPMLPEKLAAEHGAILKWAINGCLAWQRQGLNAPDSVKAATDEYLVGEDAIQAWLDDCCDVSASRSSLSGASYNSYKKWCEDNGEFCPSQKRFSQNLASRGFETKKGTGGVRMIIGFAVREIVGYGDHYGN